MLRRNIVSLLFIVSFATAVRADCKLEDLWKAKTESYGKLDACKDQVDKLKKTINTSFNFHGPVADEFRRKKQAELLTSKIGCLEIVLAQKNFADSFQACAAIIDWRDWERKVQDSGDTFSQ